MIQKPKGTRDFLLYDADLYNYILKNFKEITELFDYKYMQTPIFESYNLFYRSVGETSDVVNKEMFIFKDKGNRQIALRPENTAGIIRSLIENKLIYENEDNKFYYYGSMFRYEKPQKGRYREFIQIGCEWITEKNIFADFEVIKLAYDFLEKIKLENIILKINNLGSIEERKNYSKILKKYFQDYKEKFDGVNLQRLEKNPLRILDDKEINHQDFIKNAPKLFDYLSEKTKEEFLLLQKVLKNNNIKYEVDYSLVRGFDYYSNLVFEFIHFDKNSENELTILGGGRYSSLVKELGGPEKEGIGFAAGLDRIMILLEQQNFKVIPEQKIFVFNKNESNLYENINFINLLRKNKIIVKQNIKNFKLNKIYNKLSKDNFSFLLFWDKKLNKNIIKNLQNNKYCELENNLENIKNIDKIKKFLKDES